MKSYDAAENLTNVDEQGRLAQTVDAGLGTTTNAWDAVGRLLSVSELCRVRE